ncbi:MAG: LamG domain-containing protein [bacterium]|nr:LamG domain-containing protein [bacterium]
MIKYKSIAMWTTKKLIIPALAFCILTLPQLANAAIIIQAPKYIGLNSGLVGYWSFNGADIANVTAFDRSGQGNNGTLSPPPAGGGPVRAIGKIGQALSFDGVNDWINAGNSSTLSFSAADSKFTLAAWVKPDTNSANLNTIISRYIGTGNQRQWAFVTTATGQIKIIISEDGIDSNVSIVSVPVLQLGTWSHVAVTMNISTDVFKMYINGAEVSITGSAPIAALFASTGNVNIGNRKDGTEGPWDGLLDDVRVYNRALTADEIKRLYKIGATLKINTSINNDSLANGLVGYWTMNAPDVAGTTAYDRSGNAKNGSALGQDISPIGLIGWWKLDGASSGSIANNTTVGFEDASGSGNNGIAKNNGTGMAWTAGKIGLGAVDFDGVDDYASTTNLAGITNTTPFSVSFWRNSTDDSVRGCMVCTARSDSPYDGVWVQMETNHSITFAIDGTPGTKSRNIRSTATPGLNTWHHIVATYDGSDTIGGLKLYVNGVSGYTTVGDTGSGTITNRSWRIGAAQDPIGNYFKGKIDEVRIYNRALSAAEISQLYNYGLPRFVPTAGKLGQGIDSTQSYVNPGNVSSSVNSFSLWMKTASSSPTINLIDLNASQNIKIVNGTVTASGLTSPSIFVDGASGSTVNAGWHHIAVTTGTAVNASAVNLGLNATTTAPLDGVLDDVRFYNRVINTDEIKRLYKIGATLKINTDVSRDNPNLNSGLVGYWSFDGKDMAGVTAYDRSGQNNNGTLSPPPAGGGPARAIGKIGQGLSFDGVNDWVTVGNPSSLRITGDITVSAWIKFNGGTGEKDLVAKWHDNPSAQLSFLLYLKSTDHSIRFIIRDNAAQFKEGISATLVQSGVWYHVVGRHQQGVVKVFVNGVPDGTTQTTNGTITDSTASVTIGANDDTVTPLPFPGTIDDVRVYNRALSSDEIKRLYNLGR